jgi:hypothetical protein
MMGRSATSCAAGPRGRYIHDNRDLREKLDIDFLVFRIFSQLSQLALGARRHECRFAARA